MKFLIFNGSLKPDSESNTFTVCKMLQLAFDRLGHECEIVTLRDLDYESATKDVDDELKPYIMKIFKNLIWVIFFGKSILSLFLIALVFITDWSTILIDKFDLKLLFLNECHLIFLLKLNLKLLSFNLFVSNEL